MRKKILSLFLVLCSIIGFAQSNYLGKLGYGISPKGHPNPDSSSQYFIPFLQEVANTCNGGIVYANGSWRDYTATSGIIPEAQKVICLLQPSSFNYIDMINYAWATYPLLHLDVPYNSTNNWTNSEMKNLFLQMLINSADSLHPTYFFIGNEINFYWEQDSLDYMNWVSFYNQAYDSIKVHSPNSKVGTTFNYEHLTGNGALTGWNTSYWNSFNNFDTSKLDVIGLTVYPFFNYQHANDVPLSYLDTFFTRIGNKPLAITETGWPGDSLIGSWYASPDEQVDFVNKIFNIISGKNVEVVNWLFLNYAMDYTDTPSVKIFKSIALRDSLGNDRPALADWLLYCNNNSIIVNINSNEINIYPNPFNEITTLEITNWQNQNYEIKIFDVFGKCFYQSEIKKQKSEIHLDLPSGIYFMQVKSNNFTQTKKLEVIK